MEFGEMYDPAYHRIDTENMWCEGLRTAVPEPNLFVYHCQRSGRWCLGYWREVPEDLGFPGGFFVNLEDLGGNPDTGTATNVPDATLVRCGLETTQETFERILEKIKGKQAKARRLSEENRQHQKDAIDWLKKRVGVHKQDSPTIKKLSEGPWVAPHVAEQRQPGDFDYGGWTG